MKANELMIGDWVRIKDGYTFKMEDVSGTSMFRRWTSDGEIMIPYGWNEIEPIPLTEEILEKNGWEIGTIPDICNGTEDWAIWPVDSEIEIPFRLQRGYDGHRWWIAVGIGGLLTHIDYVHELQHALRLCGIEKEIIL